MTSTASPRYTYYGCIVLTMAVLTMAIPTMTSTASPRYAYYTYYGYTYYDEHGVAKVYLLWLY